jgi:hypothetical protein
MHPTPNSVDFMRKTRRYSHLDALRVMPGVRRLLLKRMRQ